MDSRFGIAQVAAETTTRGAERLKRMRRKRMVCSLFVLAVIAIGVLAVLGATPVVPQSVVIFGFFVGGPAVLMWGLIGGSGTQGGPSTGAQGVPSIVSTSRVVS